MDDLEGCPRLSHAYFGLYDGERDDGGWVG